MPQPKSSRPTLVAIDPGANGGIAYTTPAIHLGTVKMPKNRAEMINRFRCFLSNPVATTPQEITVVIEKVGGYRRGSGGNLGSAMFKFGQQYERVCMALVAVGLDFQEVTPQRWQGYLGIIPKGKQETKTQFKARLKEEAARIYGRLVTLWEADALLILEYLRRTKGV